jgi:RecB family exonuclease
MQHLGLTRSSSLMAKASELVREGLASIEVSSVLIYGFADATGVTTDFLQTLLEVFGGRIYLDRPPDPMSPDETDAGVVFSRRFSERIALSTTVDSSETRPPVRPKIEMYKAFGGEAEVREAARRIQELVGRGMVPESIGVVARDLAPYRSHLRTHFHRLGIPFSGVGSRGPKEPWGHRGTALLELLRRREMTTVERWLETLAPTTLPGPIFDLRLALHSMGAGRLQEAAELRLGDRLRDESLELPIRQGFGAPDPGEDSATSEAVHLHARRRRLRGDILVRGLELAGKTRALLEEWPQRAGLAQHSERLDRLFLEVLGWSEEDAIANSLGARVSDATRGLSHDFELDYDEYVELLAASWEEFGVTDLGGRGGGVQIFDVIEARACTFAHLFLLGLNRGRFPRPVREDPLLPDSLRHVLGRSGFGVLPDLALKRSGYDEERFLFAQLLASSPEITLSWQETDDEQAFQTPSPLVERLRWSQGSGQRDSWREPPTARAVFSMRRLVSESSAPRPAFEFAVLAGMFADRPRFRQTLRLALEETRQLGPRAESSAATEIAAARLRILAELDPVRGTSAGESTHHRLGPYFGFVGPIGRAGDPRAGKEIWVTTLERLTRCPWQVFLERILRVEPLPDPLEQLPGIEPQLVGNLVHRLLEKIVFRRLTVNPRSLQEAIESTGVVVDWPSEEELAEILGEEAQSVVRDQGIALPGFSRALQRVARSFLEAARSADWPSGTSRLPVVAAELTSALKWRRSPGLRRKIAFRADRVDRDEGGLVQTDYKTGRSTFGSEKSPFSESRFHQAMRTGEWLQPLVYALAAGSGEAAGRLLFLHPDFEDQPTRQVVVRADERLRSALDAAIAAGVRAWDQGTFFPRLVEPDHQKNVEPKTCQYCAVAEACLRGESAPRGRIREWTAARDPRQPGDRPWPRIDSVIVDLWYLPLLGGQSRSPEGTP